MWFFRKYLLLCLISWIAIALVLYIIIYQFDNFIFFVPESLERSQWFCNQAIAKSWYYSWFRTWTVLGALMRTMASAIWSYSILISTVTFPPRFSFMELTLFICETRFPRNWAFIFDSFKWFFVIVTVFLNIERIE